MSTLSSLFLLILCITTTSLNALKTRLINIHSPESPLYRPNLTEPDRLKELFQITHARLHSLASNATVNDEPGRPPLSRQGYLYLVQVGMGSFDGIPSPSTKDVFLAFDTGSDLIWMQCQGCQTCFRQSYPYYPMGQSKSYKLIQQPSCGYVGGTWTQDRCEVERSYGSGQSVKAVAAQETFAFPTSVAGEFGGLENVIFGCGYNMINFGSFDTPENKISGIFGMSYGTLSFVEAGEELTEGRFSYCLQPLSDIGKPTSAPMFIRWGSDVLDKPGMKSTPMPKLPRSLYYLTLEGISVAGERLDIPSGVFAIKPDGSGGCIIDSGTAFSVIALQAYSVFEQKVDDFMVKTNKNLRKVKPEKWFGTCYERFADPPVVVLPLITFHFANNADFYVKGNWGFTWVQTGTGVWVVCASVLPSGDKYRGMSVLGAIQQVNHRIIYDTKNQQPLFQEEECAQGSG